MNQLHIHQNKMATTTSTNHKESLLPETLELLSKVFKGASDEVDLSKSFLKAGVSTKLVRTVEDSIKNPVVSLLKAGSDMNSFTKELLNGLVQKHFSSRNDLIEKAFYHKSDILSFYVVLKTRTEENISDVNSFFNDYYGMEYSDLFPIVFIHSNSDRISRVKDLVSIEL